MTNLDRLAESDLLFDGFVSFVNAWAEQILTNGKFETTPPMEAIYGRKLPNLIQRFHELSIRWPFLELGEPFSWSVSEPLDENGRFPFCALGVSELAFYRKDNQWKFWEYDSEDGPGKPFERDLTVLLVELGLESLTYSPWGVRNGYWDEEPQLLTQYLEEAEIIYHGRLGDTGDVLFNYTDKHWAWHRDGLLIQFQASEFTAGGAEITLVPSVRIGCMNPKLEESLLSAGCLGAL